MFEDRISAGKKLVEKLKKYEKENPLVIALPRGGVAVGFPIAKKLHAPLEVEIVRKLGAPQNLELGIGAIAEDGILYVDNEMMEYLHVSQNALQVIQDREMTELERRKKLYRNGKPLPLLTNRTVILVDDGLATGVSARAAILSIKKHHPKKIIFAVPVCSKETTAQIQSMVDSIICIEFPEQLEAIGRYYGDFSQVSDDEVVTLLRRVNGNNPLPYQSEIDFNHKIVW